MSQFLSSHKGGLCLSVDSVVSATRTTMCDVMCTTNTPTMCSVPGELPAFQRLKPDASMPYNNRSAPKLPKGNTSFTVYKNIEIKNCKSDELKKERETFFSKMEADRKVKLEREMRAVVKLQAFVRGILARPWPEETRKSKKPPVIRLGVPNSEVVLQLQDELCGHCVKLGLKPISGLSLEYRNKTNKRRKRIELAAALRLQSYFRMIKCVLTTRSKMLSARKAIRNRAALVITKFFRWVRRVAAHDKMQNAHRNSSVIKIQTRFRMFLAYHRVKRMHSARIYSRRANDAQIIIRRNLFDKIRKNENGKHQNEETVQQDDGQEPNSTNE